MWFSTFFINVGSVVMFISSLDIAIPGEVVKDPLPSKSENNRPSVIVSSATGNN